MESASSQSVDEIDNEYPATNRNRFGSIQKIAVSIVMGESAMEKRVSKAIFKSKACELFRQIEMLGETVIVTDRGQPTIEIRPYRGKHENPLELLRSSRAFQCEARVAAGSVGAGRQMTTRDTLALVCSLAVANVSRTIPMQGIHPPYLA